MDNEIWTPIYGHELDYEISNYGRVRRISGGDNTTIGKIRKQYNGHGYLNVALCTGGAYTRYRTHVLVARAFVPNPENKPQVNHKDGDKAHNYYENLEWVTPSENQLHAVAHGLHMRLPGEANPASKLTAEQVSQIRTRRVCGEKVKQIAATFQIHEQTVYKIISGKRW